jgi:hypothetical protein
VLSAGAADWSDELEQINKAWEAASLPSDSKIEIVWSSGPANADAFVEWNKKAFIDCKYSPSGH